MPPLIIIAGIAFLVFVAIQFGLFPPLNTQTLLRIRNGKVIITKGAVKAHARENAVEILAAAGVTQSFIAITSANRVAFGRGIPRSIQQRLRNVLLNQ